MDTSVQAVIIGGLLFNILISSGALWRLIDFSRGYGKLEQKVEDHGKRIDRVEGQLFPDAPLVRR